MIALKLLSVSVAGTRSTILVPCEAGTSRRGTPDTGPWKQGYGLPMGPPGREVIPTYSVDEARSVAVANPVLGHPVRDDAPEFDDILEAWRTLIDPTAGPIVEQYTIDRECEEPYVYVFCVSERSGRYLMVTDYPSSWDCERCFREWMSEGDLVAWLREAIASDPNLEVAYSGTVRTVTRQLPLRIAAAVEDLES